MHIVIPAAGRGSRFKDSDRPKPFIKIHGRCMIDHVIDSINVEDKKVQIIILREHTEFLQDLENPVDVVIIDQVTDGAACTIGRADLSPSDPFVVVNCDNIVNTDYNVMFSEYEGENAVVVMEKSHGPWSYALVGATGRIRKIAEKDPISNLATCGVYMFSSFGAYLTALGRMCALGMKHNNEYYLAPVYNFLDDVVPLYVEEEDFLCLGTPEHLAISKERMK